MRCQAGALARGNSAGAAQHSYYQKPKMGIVGFEIQSSATVSSVFSSYTIMLIRKAIPKSAATAAPSLQLASAFTAGRMLPLCCEKKPNLFCSFVARSMVNGQYPTPPEVPGPSTPSEIPTKRTDYPTPLIQPEVPGLPTGPEIEIDPGRELPMQPPGIPEVPNPFPRRGPEIPVPPMPSPPPDVPFPRPPDKPPSPPRVPPDPDILPPSMPPEIPPSAPDPDILPPTTPPDIKPPPGPSVLF
ncbi:unnamed protein product [Linum trigynum]|uniref:Uncharacterized protein n=2 Tax=Linum trigynum TaxID=586398 RepID=A0AAV2GNH8_9ROSI